MASTDRQLPPSIADSLNSTKVSYRALGRSGLRVSIPILGTMSLGHKAWVPWVEDDETKVTALLKAAYDAGLNTWDTANVYSNGVSETLIGKAIATHQIPRHKLVLMTKCWGTVGETPDASHVFFAGEMARSKDYQNQYGLGRIAIFNAVEASLKRLGTEYIDLLQIHRVDHDVPVEETMKALHDLVESGKVRYIGASSMWTWQFQMMQNVAEKNGWTKFVSMQNHYSLCYREEEREMIPYCKATGVGIIPYAPLFRGYLARPLSTQATFREEQGDRSFSVSLTDADKAVVQRVEELAQKKGWPMAHVALAWMIQKGATPIVGLSNLKRLQEALDIYGKVVTEEESKYLEEPYIPKVIDGHA